MAANLTPTAPGGGLTRECAAAAVRRFMADLRAAVAACPVLDTRSGEVRHRLIDPVKVGDDSLLIERLVPHVDMATIRGATRPRGR